MYKISDEMHKYILRIYFFLQITKTFLLVKTLTTKGFILLKKN